MENNEKVQELRNEKDLLFELQQIDMINDVKFADREIQLDTTIGCGGIFTILCC